MNEKKRQAVRDAADNDDTNHENAELAEEQAKIAQEKVLFAGELRAPLWTEVKEKKEGRPQPCSVFTRSYIPSGAQV